MTVPTSGLMPTRVLAGRSTLVLSLAPAIEATPDYSDGDVLGGKQTLAGIVREAGYSARITWASVYSKVDIGTSIPIRLMIFNADPASSTFTENSAPSVHADDIAKLCGIVDLSQRLDLGTPVVLFTPAGISVPVQMPAAGVDAYCVAIAGGTINFGTTSDIAFKIGIDQD